MKEKQLRFQDLEIWRIAADLSLVLFEYSDVLDRKKILPVDLRPLITANLAPSPGTRPCCLALSSSSVDAIPLWPCPPSSFVNAIPLLCCLDGALSRSIPSWCCLVRTSGVEDAQEPPSGCERKTN